MNTNFPDIIKQSQNPTSEILRKALEIRGELSVNKSNFITYMAGFSHYEFAEKIFDEFGLIFADDTSILYDYFNKKLHVKILLNDPSSNVKNLEIFQISKAYKIPIFKSFIALRNKIDGSYVNKVRDEINNLNLVQLEEYKSRHIDITNEDVLSYEICKNKFDFVIHFTTVSQRNVPTNLASLFSRVHTVVFVNSSDTLPNVSLTNIQKKKEIYPLLNQIKWCVIDSDYTEEIIGFLREIGAEYTLLPYMGDNYDYFQDLISNIEVFMMQHCQNV